MSDPPGTRATSSGGSSAGDSDTPTTRCEPAVHLAGILLALGAPAAALTLPRATPESVGLSSDGLEGVTFEMQSPSLRISGRGLTEPERHADSGHGPSPHRRGRGVSARPSRRWWIRPFSSADKLLRDLQVPPIGIEHVVAIGATSSHPNQAASCPEVLPVPRHASVDRVDDVVDLPNAVTTRVGTGSSRSRRPHPLAR